MRYAVSIDRVVLRGFGPVDRRRVSSGLAEELHRLVSRAGLPTDLSGVEAIDGGSVHVQAGDDTGTGRSIARGVYGSLRR